MVCVVIADIGVYRGGLLLLMNLNVFGSVQFLAILAIGDFHGFILIYRLIIDMKGKKEMPHKFESENSFALLLRRIKQFHGIFLLVIGTAFIYYLYLGITNIRSPIIPGPKTPNEFDLGALLPAVLATWVLYTWWAWIPRNAVDLERPIDRTTCTTSPPPSGSLKSTQKDSKVPINQPNEPEEGKSKQGEEQFLSTSTSHGIEIGAGNCGTGNPMDEDIPEPSTARSELGNSGNGQGAPRQVEEPSCDPQSECRQIFNPYLTSIDEMGSNQTAGITTPTYEMEE